MRKLLIITVASTLLALLVFLPGCSKNEAVDIEIGAEGAPESASAASDPDETAAGDSGTAGEGSAALDGPPQLTVGETVAYVFEGSEGVTLYGALDFTNEGGAPAVVSNINMTFTVGGKTVEHSFTPVLAEHDVIEPGMGSYAAVWITDPTLKVGAPATVTASIDWEATQSTRLDLAVSDIYLADNYPGFTTMSGSLVNPRGPECSMNMVYVGFYSEDGSLLGVWYFTKNALLEQGGEKRFTVHMKELPVESLSALTAQTRHSAFGFN